MVGLKVRRIQLMIRLVRYFHEICRQILTGPVEPVIPPPPEAISSESAATINPQVMFDPTQVDQTAIPPLNQNGQPVDQSDQQQSLVQVGQQVNAMGQQLFQGGQEIDP
eukprot:520734_1